MKTPADPRVFDSKQVVERGDRMREHSCWPAALRQPRVREGRRGRKNAEVEVARRHRQAA